MSRCGEAVLLVVACLLAAPTPGAAPGASSALLDDVLDALYKVLKFLLDHPPDLIADTVFGVVIAKGQLKNLEQLVPEYPDKFLFQPSRRTYVLLATKILEKMCEEIAAVALAEPPVNATGYKIIMEKLIRFDLWELHRPMRQNTLWNSAAYQNSEDLLSNMSNGHELSWEEYQSLTMSGSPSEPQSDKCIVEILNTSTCVPSQECRYVETGGPSPTGYSTTHRLLYLQVARQVGCADSPYFSGLDDKITELCAAILKEAEFISELRVPTLLQDLFIEQITLCGIEGFAEFIRPEWIGKILSLQRAEGCYGDMAELLLEAKTRTKRNDVESEDGCMMHVTGLAAAALSLSARGLVEINGY